jgi:hypothetical protein
MARKKFPWKEGDWIAIPLVDRGGWGVGLIARLKAPTIIGYFFGPRRAKPPVLEDLIGLTPDQAVLIADTGDMGLRDQEWLVIGSQPDFQRADWPMPVFGSDNLAGQYYAVTYDEDRPNHYLGQKRISAEEYAKLPRDGSYGHVALSITLDKVLAEREALVAA